MKAPDKIVFFTDIHYGLRNNEKRHNQECDAFIKWMITVCEEHNIKTSIFGGDWHHHRSNVHISTLNYSVNAFETLNNYFDNHYQIIGNHDLHFKEKRELNSVEFAREFDKIKLVNEITKVGDFTLCPWLVGNEHKRMSKIETPYIFGHFEVPHFLMNAQIEMPDVGKINPDTFDKEGQHIFSGHFHKRQTKKNKHGALITYAGNCFPHNFSDAQDDERGIMILELGKEPVFVQWPGAPKFRVYNLSELLENPENYIDPLTVAKINIDLDIDYEEASVIREGFLKDYGAREIKLVPMRDQPEEVLLDEGVQFETVEQILNEYIQKVDSNSIDKQLLSNIFNDL